MAYWYLALVLVASGLKEADAIFCYQCNSTQLTRQFQCGESFSDSDIPPTSCDNVYGAKYCIKQIGHIEGIGIKCYQCYAAFNISCTDVLIRDGGLQATDCDHVFEASYCVKTTGLYAGGVGTRRFCSSSDLGSYCNYVRQPGDKLKDYRSCFYTCDSDGCNNSTQLTPGIFMTLFLVLAAIEYIPTYHL